MTVKLEVIIVNYNTVGLLRKCLTSVYEHRGELSCNITVVDNASSDSSVDMLKTEFKDVSLIQNSVNLGFAKANNMAMRTSESEYCFLLNSDTEINDNIFNRILDYLDAHPSVGMLGCRLRLPNGSRQVGDAGYDPSITTAFNYAFFLSKFFPEICHGLFLNDESNKTVSVDWVSGAALIVRRSVLKDVGLLDEEYFMYAEDIEWGVRMKKHGWQVHYFPSAAVVHHMGGSMVEKVSTAWIENLFGYVRGKRSACEYRIFVICLLLGFMVRIALYRLFIMVRDDSSTKKKYSSLVAALSKTMERLCA